jgi:hypothetical protein
MSPLDTFAKSAAVLAFGLAALGSPALADESQLYGVTSIDVSLSDGAHGAPEITVKNVANSHHLSDLQLAVQGNQIAVGVMGYVGCTGVQIENWTYREGHFLSKGAFGIGRTSLLLSEALPNSSDIDHTSDMDAHTFQLPVAMLANPQIGIDPVAVVMAAAEQAPSKIGYLRQNHVLTVKIPLRWEAGCASYTRNKITKKTIIEAPETSYLTKNVELKIKYQGDPQLFEVNAQLGQGGGMPGQLQAGAQPLKITQMTFQPNMPHHVGACPATATIRVNYQGQGKGDIRIRINFGNTPHHESEIIAFDSKDGMQHYDFELETPKGYKVNFDTVMHNLRVYVRGKGAEEQVWPSDYQYMNSAVWKTRCTPQLNPALGGGAGAGKVGGYQNGGGNAGTAPVLQLKKQRSAPPTSPTRVLPRTGGDPVVPTIQRAP